MSGSLHTPGTGGSRRLVVNRVSGFGDVLMLTAVIHEIRRREPSAFITVRTNHDELFHGNRDVDEVLKGEHIPDAEVRKLFPRHDRIFNLDHRLESYGVVGDRARITDQDYMTIPRMDLLFRHLGLAPPGRISLQYHVREEEAAGAQGAVRPLTQEKSVVVVLNSTSRVRTYPMAYSLEVVRGLLKDHNVIATENSVTAWGPAHPFNRAYHRHRRGVVPTPGQPPL